MTIYTKPVDLPAWAESGDRAQPTNAEIQTGWPTSTLPPSRQRFNWVLNYVATAARYFMQRSIAEWDNTEDYPLGGRVQSGGVTWVAVSANLGITPGTDATKWERWGYASTELLPRIDSLISISVAGSASPTLTQAQYDNGIITLTGALTANINVIFPNLARKWVVRNNTTGAFTLGLKTSVGTAYALSQNSSQAVYCDAANNIFASFVAGSSVPDASTTVKGIVELATDAETQTGTDPLLAITPSNLTSRTATLTRTGIVELADTTEAQALSDAVRAITPATLAAALQGGNQSLAANGYQKLPGGLILQWGTLASINAATASPTITFPVAFPSTCIVVLPIGNTSGTSQAATYIATKTPSNFTVYNPASVAVVFSYLAIGY